MLRMAWIVEGLEKFKVSMDAAHILERARPGTVKANQRHLQPGLEITAVFNGENLFVILFGNYE